MAYTDGYYWSNDGLRLHYRDYAGGDPSRPLILCIPGLTRNARDFEGLAERLAGRWRVLAVDVGSSRVDLQACKLEYSIVSPK